jgi:hypothetical protein
MQHKWSILLLLLLSTLSLSAVNISGTISYERVHPLHNGSSTKLNWSNISTEKAKQVIVEAINNSGNSIATTSTDDNGKYLLSNLPSNTNVKIRVYAKMFKSSKWDVKVIDNTNANALYVIEGDFASTGTQNSRRNLKTLASTKQSPPFAILGSIYQAMQKVLKADSSVVFPSLKMNWSVNNTESGTYYDGNDNIMIQGDQKGDSDEYDDHIMIHEWGHYFEAKFSRADSIGGGHASGNHLDIRLAFGEGWGNALSGMVTDDPIYFDTMTSAGTAVGWNMNVENATHDTPGWFSEASTQRILYNLYDSHDDGTDHLSLGFKPIYEVLVGPQKTTKAFTSLFTFITALKEKQPSSTQKIDAIVGNEEIATIDDIYGTNRLSNVEAITLPLYTPLTINRVENNICTSSTYGISNKLNNHKYIKFDINENKSYPIEIVQTNGRTSDPDFAIFQTSPFKQIALQESGTQGSEKATYTLPKGSYILDLYDIKNTQKACFSVSIGDKSDTEPINNSNESSSNSVGISLPENKFIALLFILGITILPTLFIRKELKI